MLTGCASSTPSSEVASFKLSELPPNVYAEASRVVKLPAGACDAACVKRLVAALRKSELRKLRAVKSAIAAHDRNKAYLAKRGKAAKNKAAPFGA